MANKHFLAVDIGASSGRGIVGSFDGEKLALEEKHRFINEGINVCGTLTWDVLRMFTEIKNAITNVHRDGIDLVSAGIDTWGVDYGYIDKNGALLTNPIHYRDLRNDRGPGYAFQKLSEEEIYRLTGIQSLGFNTVYQICADMSERPHIYDAADKLLFMPDLLGYMLTGEKRAEYTITSTGALLNAEKRDYSKALLEKLGIRKELFMPLSHPGDTIGSLLPAVTDEVGKNNIKLVNIASHDTASAVLAVPAKGEDFIYISSGTWSLMGVESRTPVINDVSQKYNFTNEGGAFGSIRFLTNIMGLWIEQESRRQWRREGKEFSFNELSMLAREAEPLKFLINPEDPIFSPPGDMPARIVKYCKDSGQGTPETAGEIVRCIFDSLALKYRYTIENIEKITGKHYTHIDIVGGGVQETVLCKLAACACKRTVFAGPVEATAIGNITMQAIAAGEIANVDEARHVIRNSFEINRYDPENTDIWDTGYEKFLKICMKNK